MKENKSLLVGNPRGLRGFFAWIKTTQPRIADAVLAKLGRTSTLAGLGIAAPEAVTTSEKPAAPSTIDKIKDMILGASQAYLSIEQMKAQKKVMDLQLSRAQAGLPPADINMESYGLVGPSVSVGLSPTTRKVLIYGGIGLAAVYLLPKFLRR